MCYSHCYHLLETYIVVLANEGLHLDGEQLIDLEESTFWKNESNVISLAQHYAIALSNVSCPSVELNSTQLVCWSLIISRLMLIL